MPQKRNSKKRPSPAPASTVTAKPLNRTKGRRVFSDAKRISKAQKSFAIWASKSNSAQIVSRFLRFLPKSPEYLAALAKINISPEQYASKLAAPDRTTQRAGAINRGACLVLSAGEWRNPNAGSRKQLASPTRGEQWRLAMAWTGMELILDALFPRFHQNEGDTCSELAHLLGLKELPEAIQTPQAMSRSALTRNMWKEEVEILTFLEVRGGKPRKVLDGWWIQKRALTTYPQALQAARAIRDLTFHGLLSASRLKKFGIHAAGKTGTTPLDALLSAILAATMGTLELLLAREVVVQQ